MFHDDQHGTAVVVLAAAINALRVVGKTLADAKVVVSGAGCGDSVRENAGGCRVKNLIGCDIHGVIHHQRDPAGIQWWVENTNPENKTGKLNDVIDGADLFLGVSTGGVLTSAMVQRMAVTQSFLH